MIISKIVIVVITIVSIAQNSHEYDLNSLSDLFNELHTECSRCFTMRSRQSFRANVDVL